MAQYDNPLSNHTNSIERIFLKHKSCDELIQIIMELQDKVHQLEEIRLRLIRESLEHDDSEGVGGV